MSVAMDEDVAIPLWWAVAAIVVVTVVVVATTTTTEIIAATAITNVTTDTVTTTATGVGGDPVAGGLQSGVMPVSPGQAAQLAKATFD